MHQRLGHPSPKVMKWISEVTVGVEVVGKAPTIVEYDVCGQAKARAKIARATSNSWSQEPGMRLLIDIFYGGDASDGSKRFILFADENCGIVWVESLPLEINLVSYVERFFVFCQNQWGVRFKSLRIDKEGHFATEQLEMYCWSLGVEYEEVPVATPAQGGGYE